MTRFLLALLLISMLLMPFPILAQDTATPTDALDDAPAIVNVMESAAAPAELPGNIDEEIELVTWEDHYGEELEGTLGAWVITGSPELPIASLMIFESPESAQVSIETYTYEHRRVTLDGIEAWTIADRGKWVCVAAVGSVVIFGQAEPQPGESDDDVRQRSCEVVQVMHTWLLDRLAADTASATPPATPGE